ncbi:MAG TPA: NADPH:quinone reductase [Candidatus Acidoferrales bacterium]|nr:NADPH:quinone reductase [Candidatus Acidoferrales bacterium]
MKAIVVHEFGAPEVMKLENFPTPKAGAGQVVVRIHAAGVNPFDTYMRSGIYAIKPPLPYVPGGEGAGVVHAVGEGVTKWKAGDRVYVGHPITGTYAEYALATESQLHRLPERVSYAKGAGIYVACGTAYHALHHQAKARGSETLLVHGASGGVGIAAVQIGRAMGMTVIGTAGSDKGLELVKHEGAHHAFNHRNAGYTDGILNATNGRGVDVVLEMLANVNLAADLKLLARFGRVIVIGSRGDITITPRDLMARSSSVRGFVLWGISEADEADMIAGLEAGLENESVRPVVGKELSLSEAVRAHKEVLEAGAHGKIILVP